METPANIDELFGPRSSYPDPEAQARLARLVGLDLQRERLGKVLGVLVNAAGVMSWAERTHPCATEFIRQIVNRPPLVVLAGDVGTGKTELAETIGDLTARTEKIAITLYPMSLSTRGSGRVGEMTQLITAAFDAVAAEAKRLRRPDGKASGAAILLVDEADALAQSREAAQMHHEDRAGVNTFIRGIDRFAKERLPAAVIMCTNRLGALDPAIRRRAAEIFEFARPNDEQRYRVVAHLLGAFDLTDKEIMQIVVATGPTDGRSYGFTYSDLTQRFLPAIILDAYPGNSVTFARVMEVLKTVAPTAPFREANRS
jgi:SpoVK/Ycf46/Vps4 family AAA+-type ATPase